MSDDLKTACLALAALLGASALFVAAVLILANWFGGAPRVINVYVEAPDLARRLGH